LEGDEGARDGFGEWVADSEDGEDNGMADVDTEAEEDEDEEEDWARDGEYVEDEEDDEKEYEEGERDEEVEEDEESDGLADVFGDTFWDWYVVGDSVLYVEPAGDTEEAGGEGEVDADGDTEPESTPSDPFAMGTEGLVVAVGLVVVMVVVVVVVCPLLWPLSLDLSLDRSLGLLVPTSRRVNCTSPLPPEPAASPLPSSSPPPPPPPPPRLFSAPLPLSSPLFFPLPRPLPALEVTVSVLWSPGWVVDVTWEEEEEKEEEEKTMTQVPPLVTGSVSVAGLEEAGV